MGKRLGAITAVVALLTAVTACGSSDDKSKSTSTPAAGGSSTASTAAPKLSGTITVSTWGGDYTKAEKKFFGDPFTAATGVKVKYLAASTSPMAPVMLQAQSGQMKIDVVDAESPEVLHSKGLLADFPDDLEQTLAQTSTPGSFNDFEMKIGQTAVVIACNPDIVKKCPTNPQQFFDVKNYPGTRGVLVGLPQTVLDFALVADGVAPDKVYPMDIPRAIDKLKQIKPNVQVWAAAPPQGQQVLADKDVGMEFIDHPGAMLVKNTMIKNLQVAWDGALSTNDGMVVTKDAPNKDAALAYIKFIAQHAQEQAGWAKALGYPTPTKELKNLLPAKLYEALPAAHNVTPEDDSWLVQHLPEVQKAFQQFNAG